jgi:hypothetical protein
MSHTKDFYLLLLEHALIEMRAAPVEGNPELASQLADMFHNVPGTLRLPWSKERDDRVYGQIRAKAAVYGLGETLNRWEQHVCSRLERDATDPGTNAESIISVASEPAH